MIKSNTSLIQKDPQKGTIPNNERVITYLSMILKILTAQMKQEIYYSLESHKLISEEKGGSHQERPIIYRPAHFQEDEKIIAMTWIKSETWAEKLNKNKFIKV